MRKRWFADLLREQSQSVAATDGEATKLCLPESCAPPAAQPAAKRLTDIYTTVILDTTGAICGSSLSAQYRSLTPFIWHNAEYN
jgi:hypothetical protein